MLNCINLLLKEYDNVFYLLDQIYPNIISKTELAYFNQLAASTLTRKTNTKEDSIDAKIS